jgi:hypothetical protein
VTIHVHHGYLPEGGQLSSKPGVYVLEPNGGVIDRSTAAKKNKPSKPFGTIYMYESKFRQAAVLATIPHTALSKNPSNNSYMYGQTVFGKSCNAPRGQIISMRWSLI